MLLYRPVGLYELELIAQIQFAAFPPRLEHQPIFYPVLNFPYAEQIARDWNTADAASGYAGFVTKFEVSSPYIDQFAIQVVGGRAVHQELWIPAEELETFNQHIIGPITVEAAYYGSRFSGTIDTVTNLPTHIVQKL